LKTIESFHTYGTPPIDQYTGPLRGHTGKR